MLRNIVGPPARGDDFFDRQELIELLWNRLDSGNVLLAAPRRFGKTSLMYQLLDDPQESWKPIHVDAESITEPVNFLVAVMERLTADNKIRKLLMDSWKRTEKWFRDLVADAEIKGPWDVGFKIKLKEKMGPDWKERGEALLHALSRYDKNERLLIVIDELPVMLHLFRDNDISDAKVRSFLYWFRRLRTDPNIGLTNCRFLIGGSIGIEHRLSQLGASDSFNDFERVALPELGPAKAKNFLRLLLRARRLRLSPSTQNAILRLVGAPIPYILQLFVSEIATAKANGLERIGPKTVEDIYEERVLGAGCKAYFQHYYDRLRYYEKPLEAAAKEILKAMALAYPDPVRRSALRTTFLRAMSEGGTDEVFSRLLGDLENDFYIRCLPKEAGCVFASKVLCDWWRRYYAF